MKNFFHKEKKKSAEASHNRDLVPVSRSSSYDERVLSYSNNLPTSTSSAQILRRSANSTTNSSAFKPSSLGSPPLRTRLRGLTPTQQNALSEIASSKCLQYSLSRVSLSTEFMQELSSKIAVHPSLKYLQLRACRVSVKLFRVLVDGLKKNTSLTEIDLTANPISFVSIENDLNDLFLQNFTLTTLDITKNYSSLESSGSCPISPRILSSPGHGLSQSLNSASESNISPVDRSLDNSGRIGDNILDDVQYGGGNDHIFIQSGTRDSREVSEFSASSVSRSSSETSYSYSTNSSSSSSFENISVSPRLGLIFTDNEEATEVQHKLTHYLQSNRSLSSCILGKSTQLDLSKRGISELPKIIFFSRVKKTSSETSEENMPSPKESYDSMIFQTLEEMDLSRNHFSLFTIEAFSRFINLKVLNLDHNSLTSLEIEDLSPLSKLTNLSLKYNQLANFPSSFVSQLVQHSLTSLDLSGNKIETLDDWDSVIQLKVLNIQGNPLSSQTSSIPPDVILKGDPFIFEFVQKQHKPISRSSSKTKPPLPPVPQSQLPHPPLPPNP